MGLLVRRVPINFSYALEKVWQGFRNPHYNKVPCSTCDESGYSPAGKQLADQWHGYASFDPVDYGSTLVTMDTPWFVESIGAKVRRSIEISQSENKNEYYTNNGRIPLDQAIVRECERMLAIYNTQWSHHLIQPDVDALLSEQRLHHFTSYLYPDQSIEEFIRVRAYYVSLEQSDKTPEECWVIAENEYRDRSGCLDQSQHLYWLPHGNGFRPTPEQVNIWHACSLGHDAINRGICIRARALREGIDLLCPKCEGDGSRWPDKASEERYNNWKRTDPPIGDAYQMWETVSDGSPISPPFLLPAQLARWMAEKSSRNHYNHSKEDWLRFITECGGCPSGGTVNGRFVDGVTFALESLK